MKATAKAETYRLNPASNVSLQPHIGHKVEITGTWAGDRTAARAEREKTDVAAGTSGSTSAGVRADLKHLENVKSVEVTAVKHLSPVCEPGKQ
jgi:hypothetical protein